MPNKEGGQIKNKNVKLEVNMKDETIWLNREQLLKLFYRNIKIKANLLIMKIKQMKSQKTMILKKI